MHTRSHPSKVDLHVHTPAGGDYRGDPATSVADIVDKCADAGLDLIAIADHMTLDGYSETALHAISSEHGVFPPSVLPGVELKIRHAGRPTHLLAIFDPADAFDHFAAILNPLSAHLSGNGTLASVEIAADPQRVAGLIRSRGAICIVAHADRFSRAAPDCDRHLRELVDSGLIDAVEFDDPAIAERFAAAAGVAGITSSDAHSLDEIGRRCSRLHLSESSFEGLRRALALGGRPALAVERRDLTPEEVSPE